MATAPSPAALPLFYKDLVPLNKQEHGAWRSRSTDKAQWLVGNHAVPLALMGLNEGVNVFVDEEGAVTAPVYMPAYARRYPFMLARLRPDADDLTLCFDPTSDLLGEFDDGLALFEGEDPSESCKATLSFCEQFEVAGQKTANFIAEIKKHELLIDGELTLQMDGREEPFVYRGFQMVDEKKLRDMRGDVLRGWNQSGLLPLIYAHLFSLELVRELFGRQLQQGKGPIALQ
jgi:hypothetical protein